MSQQKAQLVSPIDTFTPSGINVTGAGIVTSTSFVGSGGTVTGIVSGSNLNVGVITATSYSGDGSSLTGVGASAFVGVVTAAQSGTTTIDLSLGNSIYFTQDTNTTVAFANTTTTQKLKFIRVKDDTTTARTITWPASIIWNGGTAPTLISAGGTNAQIFNITTRDQGVTWYGYEAMQDEVTTDVPFSSGTLFVWGRNTSAHLGLNDIINRSSPHQIPGTTWSSFDQGNYLTAATKSDGTLWIWGNNERGGIGVNDIIPRSSPTQVPGTQWSTTKFEMCAGRVPMVIKTDGTLWVIGGENGIGEAGLNDIVHRSSPNQIPGTWSKVSQSSQESLAIKTDGTLWVWGFNNNGQFGLNDIIPRSSPIQIPGTQWSHCFNGGLNTHNAYATKTDGTLWVWGSNNTGQLAQNDIVYRSSPTQIPGTEWVLDSVSTNDTLTSALKTNGTLWVWGSNANGEIGAAVSVNYSSPHQIPGTQWQSAKMNMIANKTDGTLWAWGYSGFGAMGNNQSINYSSPHQIPGTQWSIADMNRGDYMTGAFQPSS
jgi:alpha-tubulin suppressor-like RCC1 family protein